jgi:UDP-N-acetylglucosamine 2-epimerase (non-hydrolysing)
VQEETTCLGVPCVTVRDNTERPATIDYGTNILAGTTSAGIRQAIARQMERTPADTRPEKWDGRAAQRIISILAERFSAQAASVSSHKGEHGHRPTTDSTQYESAMNLPAIP